jgi:hypothetical protein
VGDPVDLVRRQRGVVSEHHVGIPPPPARKVAEQRREREAAYNTVSTFAERYLKERSLRPTTAHNCRRLLVGRINPYSGEMPLKDVTLSEIKAWRASLDPKTEASNAAAYRLLRSLLSTPGWRCRTSCLPGGATPLHHGSLATGEGPRPRVGIRLGIRIRDGLIIGRDARDRAMNRLAAGSLTGTAARRCAHPTMTLTAVL